MNRLDRILPVLASYPGWLYLQFVARTNRFVVEGPHYHTLIKENKGTFIFSLWHSRVTLPIYHFRHRNLAVIVSRSKDGEFIAQIMKRFGMHATRGSASQHGSEGLLGLVHWLRNRGSAVVTPDGPRGPREIVQPGIVQLARLSAIPIIPICFSSTRHHRFSSWDRFMLPLPFGTIYMITGEPIVVPRKLDPTEFEEMRLRIERAMRETLARADQKTGTPLLEPVSPSNSQ